MDNQETKVPIWERVSFRSAAEIRNHPRFQQAHDTLVDELLSLYGDDRRLVRSLMEFVRAVTFMVIVCLDALHDPEDPATFVTMARLREALAMMGITDARRVTDLVSGLELDGFLTREVSPTDRRAHLLRPTEKMLAADREWLAAFHAPLALLYPDEPTFQAAMARDPAYQVAYRRISLSTLGFAEKISSGNPIIGFFLGHNVGIRILMVLAAEVRGKTPARTQAGFTPAPPSGPASPAPMSATWCNQRPIAGWSRCPILPDALSKCCRRCRKRWRNGSPTASRASISWQR